MDKYNIVSFMGIFVLVVVAWVFSSNRKNMNWRAIGWGIALQLLFGLCIFVLPAGVKVFFWVNEVVIKILAAASAGSKFVFGILAVPPGPDGGSLGFILMFQAFPMIIFFSALMSILYYYRIIPFIIQGFSYVFGRLMKVSGAEALVTASNIFTGVESALTIRPYLSQLTESELCTVLTAGLATVASSVLAIYVMSLQTVFPAIAGHLVSASLLSAPAAILMSKIILPEEGNPATLGTHVSMHYEREKTLFEAIINGAQQGLKMIAGIVALLIAGLGLVALIDLFLSMLHAGWSLKGLLGYIFYPFTLIIGIPSSDAGIIAKIIGERAVLTEVVSYQDLAQVMGQNLLAYPRSAVVATYALCGFTHVASLAIFIGGTAALAPNQTHTLSKVGIRAFIAATLACLMTACIAGTFFNGNSYFAGY